MNAINQEQLFNTEKHEEFTNTLKTNLQNDLNKRETLKHEIFKM
jgi:hypothetical protein